MLARFVCISLFTAVLPYVTCLAQLSDAEAIQRMAEMSQKKAATPKPDAEPSPPPIAVHHGPVYYRIPLRGGVGQTFVASLLAKGLEDAATRSPTVVVLEIDSQGGDVPEVDALIDVISRHKKTLRIVAWVKQAISAAAITSLCVDEIYMQRAGTIGAATAYRMTPGGTPQNLEEKMQSIWRARGRSAAEMGGHSPLLADGMIDASSSIFMRDAGGRIALSDQAEHGSQIVKERGKLLMMTSSEATKCGLAKGVADDARELGKLMGLEGWTECEGTGEAWVQWLERRLVASAKEWATAQARLDDQLRIATAQNPGAFDDYVGTADAESVRRWNMRSNQTSQALKNAERELARMVKVAKDCPELGKGADAAYLATFQQKIAAAKATLEAGKMRVPDDPSPKGKVETHPVVGGRR